LDLQKKIFCAIISNENIIKYTKVGSMSDVVIKVRKKPVYMVAFGGNDLL
jgi:hypothetical protein